MCMLCYLRKYLNTIQIHVVVALRLSTNTEKQLNKIYYFIILDLNWYSFGATSALGQMYADSWFFLNSRKLKLIITRA